MQDAAAGNGTSLRFSPSEVEEDSDDGSPAARKHSRAGRGQAGGARGRGRGGSGGYDSEEERYEEERSRRARDGSNSPVRGGRSRGVAASRYVGGPMGHNPRGNEGCGIARDSPRTPGRGGRGGQIVSEHKLLLCPICFQYLVTSFGKEPGQKFEKHVDENPDPLASVVKLAAGRECSLVFWDSMAFKQHYRAVHPRYEVPSASDNYLKQKIYSYLSKRERDFNYRALAKNRGGSGRRAHDRGSSDDDFAGDQDDFTIEASKILKSDTQLIKQYWGEDTHENAHMYNELVRSVSRGSGSHSPLFQESEAEESSESGTFEFVVPDDAEVSVESESASGSSSSESSGRRAHKKQRGGRRGKQRDDDNPLDYLKRRVTVEAGGRSRTGWVTGYKKKRAKFEITCDSDSDDGDPLTVDLKTLKKMLVKGGGGEEEEEEEEEDSEMERARDKEEQRRKRERKRQRNRKGPPRMAIFRDLEPSGRDLDTGREGASGRGGVARSNRRSARFGAAEGEAGRGEQVEVSDGEGDGATIKFWANCDRCKKWRHLPKEIEEEVAAADPWYCTMGESSDVLSWISCDMYGAFRPVWGLGCVCVCARARVRVCMSACVRVHVIRMGHFDLFLAVLVR
jgi:hypothetical protein